MSVSQPKPTLSVINFNGESFLPSTLDAACAQQGSFAEIIVIDNASTDGSVPLIERNYPSVRLVRLPDNGGPAAARNSAFHEARTDLVLFIDNDVQLEPRCAERLVQALVEYPSASVAAPRVLYAHNREIIQYDGADNHFLGLMLLHNQDRPLKEADEKIRKVGCIATACFLVQRSRLPENELFDEAFFIYEEDHDFSLRIRALGSEILSVPAATCLHAEGTKGLSLRSLGSYSKMRVFCLIRNRWQLLLKNYSLRSLVVLFPILVLYELAQLAIVIKKGWFVEWARALFWVTTHIASILRKRCRVQGARVNPDRCLFTGGPIPFRSELTVSRVELVARRFLDAVATAYWRGAAWLI